jgi:hypothetical protein
MFLLTKLLIIFTLITTLCNSFVIAEWLINCLSHFFICYYAFVTRVLNCIRSALQIATRGHSNIVFCHFVLCVFYRFHAYFIQKYRNYTEIVVDLTRNSGRFDKKELSRIVWYSSRNSVSLIFEQTFWLNLPEFRIVQQDFFSVLFYIIFKKLIFYRLQITQKKHHVLQEEYLQLEIEQLHEWAI